RKIAREFVAQYRGLRDGFRGIGGCLYHAPRYKLLRRQRSHRSDTSANNQRTVMEPTLTQNCALYYAEHTAPKRRAALFQMFRTAARRQTPSYSAATDAR